eukprot:scaffold3825_cov90-Skeletonema_menzelii.AAC.2
MDGNDRMDGMKVGCDRTRKREKRAKEDARYRYPNRASSGHHRGFSSANTDGGCLSRSYLLPHYPCQL